MSNWVVSDITSSCVLVSGSSVAMVYDLTLGVFLFNNGVNDLSGCMVGRNMRSMGLIMNAL